MKKNINRGFTLIELLVVIAIIGILSAVVLASLNQARNKGGDASVKSNLASIRAQAEIFFDVPQNYGANSFPVGVCNATTIGTLFADTKIAAQIAAAGDASNGGGIAQGSCVSTPLAWAVSVPLKESPGDSWCVDSKGTSRKVSPGGGDRGFLGAACK